MGEGTRCVKLPTHAACREREGQASQANKGQSRNPGSSITASTHAAPLSGHQSCVSYMGETGTHGCPLYLTLRSKYRAREEQRQTPKRTQCGQTYTETTPRTSHLLPSAQSSGTHDGRTLHSRGAPFRSAGPVCDHTEVQDVLRTSPRRWGFSSSYLY